MLISADALTFMVLIALTITTAAPILLVIFLIRDWRQGKLW
jgi:hypothetical protein